MQMNQPNVIVRGACLGLLFMLMSCSTPGSPTAYILQETTLPEATQTSPLPSATLPQPTITQTSMPTIEPDLTTRPQIWFGPLDPSPPDANRPFSGRLDFFRLFEADSPWQNAAQHVQVFKLYGGWVAWEASQAELEQVVRDVQRRGMALAFEAGPLTPTHECTGEIEGFAGPEEAIRIVQKIKAAGGTIAYVDLEHPYDAATFADAPESCHMTPEEIAANVSRFVETVRSVFPEARFGAVETARHDVEHVAPWVEAYRSVLGEDLAYFHLDLDFGRPDWASSAREIETYLHSRGIEFGLFYLGDWNDASNEEWLARAEQRIVEYEVEFGGQPDHIIFQSWHPHPQHLLPETDPGAFTYLINRYFRTRTVLSMDIETSSEGTTVINGDLSTISQEPLSGMPLRFTLVPNSGPGLLYSYTLTGTVPQGAIEADVGYRVNLECGCSAPAEFTLYEVRYMENEDENNRIPNPHFARGLEGWDMWGEAGAHLIASENGVDYALHVIAQPDQGAAINSAKFPTTPGAGFQVTFVARVSPQSLGSGYFNLIFNDRMRELRRFTIPLQAAAIPLGEAATSENGSYTLTTTELPAVESEIQVWFAGDETHWPAFSVSEQSGE
jgi:hypothetical protein